jgi:YVTN family beta-propeller protein
MSGINWQSVANPPILNAIETNWHPFFLVAPDGRVAHFGPHQSLDWITATGTGVMTSAGASIPGTHYPKQGAWAMYDAGKVIVAGGLQAIDDGTVVNRAFTIDLNGSTPVLTPTAPMANARSFANSVMLPNGEVMIVGGNTSGQFFSDVGAVFTPEIWNPTTGQWRGVADLTVPRNYHSLAMLLPDGRVWSGGGGLSGDPLTDHQDAQVFTPPQLFKADGTPAVRPQIIAAPDRIGPGTVFTVNASSGVQYFSCISMSALTHSVSTGLRYARFTHTSPSAGVYAVTAPSSINVLTPGYWMMFAVDANGVWSASRIIQVTSSTLPVVTNPGQQSVNQSSVVSLPINASAASGTLSYSAAGLPDGLNIDAGTGLITGMVTAVPGTYRSTILVTAAGQVASVSFNWIVVLPNLGSGQIMREYWTGINGETVASLTASAVYPSNPNGRDMLTSFEAPSNWDQETGQRVRGFLYVPVTGQYQFFIASDNQSSLLLSSDANPANAVEIASQPDWTPPETWTWYPQQASALITLQAGKRYYVEALVKNGAGGDNLAVGWLKPGDTAVTVIGGTYLSPYLPVNNPTAAWSFEEASWNGTAGEVKATATSLFTLSGAASGGAIPTTVYPALSGNPGTGNSAQFNGTGQSVVMPFNAALNPNDFTIAAWVRSDAVLGTAHCVLASRDESTATLRGYGLWVTTDGQWQLSTGADASGLKGGPVTVGQWTHVAATFHTTSVNGATLTGLRRLYLNGTLVAEDTSTYVPNTALPLVVGAADSPGTAFFAGAVDEVVLYQAPLSQIDILALRDLRHATSTVPNQPPQITNPGTQVSLVGAVVSLPVTANDPENNPITFSSTGLPTGLSISAASGVISGAVTTAGVFNVTLTASDGISTPASVSFIWNVSAGLTLQPLTDSPKATAASLTFAAQSANGIHPRYKWNFGDGTPETAWLTTTSITHTYAGPGRYLVTLTATDDTGILVTSTFYQAVYAAPTARKPAASSSIVYEHPATGNDRVWCVNPDNNSVSAFDVVTKARYAEITVGTSPRSLAFAPDGRLWVTNVETATISIINTSTRTVVATVKLASGSRPFGIVFDPAGAAAWVAQEISGKVLKLNPSTGAQIASIDAGGPVRHLSISADSARVYASRFITPPVPGENTATPLLTGTGGQVVVIGTASLSVQRTILLNPSTAADTSTSARGLPNYLGAAVISPDGLSAWVPSKQDNILRGVLRDGQPLNHENTVRAIVSRIDLTAQAESLPSRVDIDNSGMPSAAAYDPWGNYLFTALEASRAIAILDAWSHKEIIRFPAGRAPQGVVVSPDGGTLYVQNFMDRTITVHDVSGILQGAVNAPVTTATLNAITTEKLSALVLQGKQLFYDAQDPRLALQQYISCAVCHNDAGHDGRIWDLTGFGEGLRNTITLKGHANQGMLHWSGNFDEVQDFEGQIRTLAGGTGLMTDAQFNTGTRSQPLGDPKAGVSPDLDALAAYVKSLTTNGTSPNRTTSGALSVTAAAGQQIFRAQNCAACHSGAGFTNSALNVFADIGTIKPSSGMRLGGPLTGLDVPTLRGTWASAPYLHDGSAPTLGDAITAHKGLTLSAAELSYLTAFVASIDDAPAIAPLPFTVALSTPATNVAGTFNVTATFNAAATGFTLSKVVVTNGVASGFSGSGTSYTFQVKPTASGPVTISVPAMAAKDSTNLGNSASNLLSVNYSPVTPPLTVVLSTPTASVSAPFVVTATFSESVSGLLASGFAVTNGTVTALSSAGALWSATVTPAAAGNVNVSLPGGMTQSATGKLNMASNLITVNYAPTVSTHGLTGDYYVGKNFDHFSFTRTDNTIDFTWGEGSPDPRIPVDGFSVRWRGWITPRYTETYTLIPVTDDGVRLWVNGQLVVDDWNDHGATWNNGVVTLQAGVPVSIVMEYYEDTDSATARLLWESNSQTREVIPQSQWLVNAPVVNKTTSTGSGSANLLGTALGTSPTSGIISPGTGLQLVTRNNSSVDATLLHPAGQSGITLALESSNDLINWTPLVATPAVNSQGGVWEQLTWADLQALPGQSLTRGIIRLRVTQSGAGTAASAPVGWQQTLLHPGTQSFGLNFTQAALFTGPISSATATSVTLSEQAALVAAMNPAQQYYLEIISGPQAGHRLDLETITGTACSLLADSPGTTLPVSAMAGLAGATVSLRPHCTLGTVFDPAHFQGSTIPTNADQVLFYTSSGYSTYWLYALGTTRFWVMSGATLASMNDTIIQPGTGLMLLLASTTPAPLLTTGTVRTTRFARPLQTGYNLIANPWPIDASPSQAGLNSPACVATTSFATADQLQLWKGDVTAGGSGYLGYWLFQHPGQLIPTWVSMSDATLNSQNNATLLRAGHATFIKVQSKANSPVWIIPPP